MIVMLNNKGQALIEFVLILPIFLMILFVIIDFGMIFNAKSNLENKSNDIISLFKTNNNVNNLKNVFNDYDIKVENANEYYKITITDKVNVITPGLNLIIGNPYEIKVERIVSNVKQ